MGEKWRGGNVAVNHSCPQAVFNRKRPRNERAIINVLHQFAVIKCVILSPPMRQMRLEVEVSGNSTFECVSEYYHRLHSALIWSSLINCG